MGSFALFALILLPFCTSEDSQTPKSRRRSSLVNFRKRCGRGLYARDIPLLPLDFTINPCVMSCGDKEIKIGQNHVTALRKLFIDPHHWKAGSFKIIKLIKNCNTIRYVLEKKKDKKTCTVWTAETHSPNSYKGWT